MSSVPINYVFQGGPLVLKPPKKAKRTSGKIEALQKKILDQKIELETLQHELKVFHISEKNWGYISTGLGALAFGSPFLKNIYELVNLYSNQEDSQCETPVPSLIIGTIAIVLGISYLGAKTIVGCIGKKREALISPIEKQLEELNALQKLFEMMEGFSNEEDKEELLSQCTQQMASLNGTLLKDEYKQGWFYLLVEKLPEENDVKRLLSEAKQKLEEIEQAKKDSPKEGRRKKRKPAAKVSSEVDVELGKVHRKKTSLVAQKIEKLEPEKEPASPTKSHKHRAPTKGLSSSSSSNSGENSSASGSDSNFLNSANADNNAAPSSSAKLSLADYDEIIQEKRERLRKITKELNSKLGLDRHYHGGLYFGEQIIHNI